MQKLLMLILVSTLAGCIFPGVYKINVQQGNILDHEQLAQLNKGMSREEVRSILGTPVLYNPVQSSRDYYIYTFQESGGDIKEQRVIVYYDAAGFDHYEAQLLDKNPVY